MVLCKPGGLKLVYVPVVWWYKHNVNSTPTCWDLVYLWLRFSQSIA